MRRSAGLFAGLGVVLGTLAVAPAADAYLYWSTNNFDNQSRIGRAGLDASGTNPALVSGLHFSGGVASRGQSLYWAEATASSVALGRSTLDGAGANHAFIPGGSSETFREVATSPTRLYWSRHTNTSTSSITSTTLAGGGLQTDVPDVASTAACGLTVDSTWLYWTEGRYIGRKRLDGSVPADHDWIDTGAGGTPCGLAVTATHIYWTAPSTSLPASTGPSAGESIARAKIDGTAKQQPFLLGANRPTDIATDGQFIYWSNYWGNSISRANLDGSGVDLSFIDNTLRPVSLAVDTAGPAATPPSNLPKPAFPAPKPLRIVGVSTSNKSFAPARGSTPVFGRTSKRVKRGTVFSFRLDKPATVKIAIQQKSKGRRYKGKCRKPSRKLRKKRACTRWVTKRTLTRTARAGRNKVPFTGRIKRKALKVGSYRARFVARAAGSNPSRAVAVKFRIVRP